MDEATFLPADRAPSIDGEADESGTVAAVAAVATALRVGAARHAIYVWDGVPDDTGGVIWPDNDPDAYLEVARRLGARVLYIGETRAATRGPEGADLDDDPDDRTGDGPDGAPAELGEVIAVDAVYCVDGIQHWFPNQRVVRRIEDEEFYGEYPPGTPVQVMLRSEELRGRSVSYDGYDSSWATSPYVSYAGSMPREVTGPLRDLVDEVVANPEYDSDYRTESEVLTAAVADLDQRDATDVRYVASRVFDHATGRELDAVAEKVAAKVVALLDYNALLDDDDVATIAAAYLQQTAPDTDPRVRRRVVDHASRIAWDRGLRDRAAEQLDAQAADLLASLPADVRDQVGFTHRVAAQRALLEPYLGHVDERLLDQFVSAVRRTEESVYQASRETRYATAARALIASGENRSAVSRRLGISANVLSRIECTHRRDVELVDNDPLLDRAPELRTHR